LVIINGGTTEDIEDGKAVSGRERGEKLLTAKDAEIARRAQREANHGGRAFYGGHYEGITRTL
jgi:hypothetical protein